jgi:hypothetical protein
MVASRKEGNSSPHKSRGNPICLQAQISQSQKLGMKVSTNIARAAQITRGLLRPSISCAGLIVDQSSSLRALEQETCADILMYFCEDGDVRWLKESWKTRAG